MDFRCDDCKKLELPTEEPLNYGEMDIVESITCKHSFNFTKKESDSINQYFTLKWADYKWKQKILCWLFPRQYPHLVDVKNFRKGLTMYFDASDDRTFTQDKDGRVSQMGITL